MSINETQESSDSDEFRKYLNNKYLYPNYMEIYNKINDYIHEKVKIKTKHFTDNSKYIHLISIFTVNLIEKLYKLSCNLLKYYDKKTIYCKTIDSILSIYLPNKICNTILDEIRKNTIEEVTILTKNSLISKSDIKKIIWTTIDYSFNYYIVESQTYLYIYAICKYLIDELIDTIYINKNINNNKDLYTLWINLNLPAIITI